MRSLHKAKAANNDASFDEAVAQLHESFEQFPEGHRQQLVPYLEEYIKSSAN
ncbi:hypothetical protein PGT21_035765 [Puccinia graminis f. sp. tritici]|uniref:Uncharacterized protein n=1 Tax=Puccinia graminis f. sp. tritici TaxID=56615 RepID=A0A5B0M921_PUCGR|nr:hypothetical protein PGTUg99_028115 [Puccinia graminis f. sp. tritici]KAA1084821.1 hypothetical protein PGT21_035765 [Puccinia graminis f. sp. tritici]